MHVITDAPSPFSVVASVTTMVHMTQYTYFLQIFFKYSNIFVDICELMFNSNPVPAMSSPSCLPMAKAFQSLHLFRGLMALFG